MEAANHEVPAVPIFGRYTLYFAPWKVIRHSVRGYSVGSWSNDRDIPPCARKDVDVGSYSIADYWLVEDWIRRDNYKTPFAHLVLDLE